mmetsp:Transcript_87081/g.141149  ORF Transcript_87081/g.141149 Transcript_87081/m.141149 type:complete len:224 (+) Transcript_87081:250-921(+)
MHLSTTQVRLPRCSTLTPRTRRDSRQSTLTRQRRCSASSRSASPHTCTDELPLPHRTRREGRHTVCRSRGRTTRRTAFGLSSLRTACRSRCRITKRNAERAWSTRTPSIGRLVGCMPRSVWPSPCPTTARAFRGRRGPTKLRRRRRKSGIFRHGRMVHSAAVTPSGSKRAPRATTTLATRLKNTMTTCTTSSSRSTLSAQPHAKLPPCSRPSTLRPIRQCGAN